MQETEVHVLLMRWHLMLLASLRSWRESLSACRGKGVVVSWSRLKESALICPIYVSLIRNPTYRISPLLFGLFEAGHRLFSIFPPRYVWCYSTYQVRVRVQYVCKTMIEERPLHNALYKTILLVESCCPEDPVDAPRWFQQGRSRKHCHSTSSYFSIQPI